METRKKKINLARRKKAQFYILTAIILCVSAYAAFQKSIQILTPNEKMFKDQVDNFKLESPRVINSALFNGYKIDREIDYLVRDYNSYLASFDRTLNIVYMLKLDGEMIIYNSLIDSITAITPSFSYVLDYDEKVNITSVPWIKITVGNEIFEYTFVETEPVEFKVLFVE